MKRLLLMLMLVLGYSLSSHAQVNPQTGHGAPTGPCLGPYTDIDTGNFYVCKIGQYTLSGGGITSPSSLTTLVDVTQAPYNIKVGFFVTDATLVNGLNTISCPNSDCNFTSSMNGWLAYATNMTSDASSVTSTVVMPTGGGATCTFTFVSAQAGTCSANSSASITAAAVLVMVPADQSTGYIAALAAAAKAGISVQLADGVMGLAVCVPDPVATGKLLGNGVASSVGIHGWGKTHSIIAPLPGTPGAGATGGDGKACLGGGVGWTYHDFEVSWFGQSAIGASFNGKVGFEVYGGAGFGNSSATNLYFMSGGGSTAGFTGFTVTSVSSAYITGVFVDGAGSTNCLVNPGAALSFAELFNLVCGNASVTGLTVTGGVVDSYGGIYGDNIAAATGNGTIISGASTVFSSFGDVFDYVAASTVNAQVQCTSSAICNFDGSRIHMPNTGGTSPQALRCDSSAVCNIINTSAVGDNGGGVITFSSGSVNDEGGNRISGTTASINCQSKWTSTGLSSFTGPMFWGSGCLYNTTMWSVNGVCTGVSTASQTLGLYGTGPAVVVTTCTSVTIGLGVVAPRNGTVLALIVTATAGGVNASSGVVTVLKNGGATTATCTLGTGTTCQDVAHFPTFVLGDRISIQFTTQSADTLAGVNAQVVVF